MRLQFLLALLNPHQVYGGLRGAISFSLAYVLSDDLLYKDLLVTTTFAVIIFTVFIQVSNLNALNFRL